MADRWISVRQLERDHAGMRNNCASCGNEGTKRNPLEVNSDGMRVHSDAFHQRMRDAAVAESEAREAAWRASW